MTSRLLEEQIAAVVLLGRGKKNDAMWHVPQQDLPWHNISLAQNTIEVLKEHLSLLVRCYVSTKVIHVHNMDKTCFDVQCRSAFGLK